MLLSYFKNYKPKETGAKKVVGLQQWLPTIVVFVALLLVALYMNSQIDGIKTVINMMENQIKTVLPK